MSEFVNEKMTPWGYIIDAQALPTFINAAEFSNYTGGRYAGDRRIEANLPSASAAIRNYCGWHIYPNLLCGAVFNVNALRDAFVGPDLLIQLPAALVTSVEKVVINAKLNRSGEYVGDVYEDFDLNPGGLLKVFDVGCVDRKSKVFVKYRAGFSSEDIEDLKELTANRVTHAVTNTYGVSSEAAGGVSVSYSSAWTGSGSTSLSDDTREILNNYKVRGMY